ncbi:MAG: hypothetical protein HKP10_01555 [Kiritimatiellales bacterium]|nr:hypothetical protein [Pontiella sp.]NNJ69957.1 hypothetical protein [Kiritimatiellales bacterium]
MKYKSVLIAALLAFLVGCQSKDVSSKTAGSVENDYHWWNLTNALTRANNDIKSGDIKIYFAGGRAALPAGIKREDRKLIEKYPADYSGAGCVILNKRLRELQEEYGVIYNQRILEWIKEN